MTLDLTIPGLPPTNSSDKLNRWVWRKLKKDWEALVITAVLEACGRWPATLDQARVTITRCSTREPDYDGLVQGAKFLLDGLVRAGVIRDDKPSVIGQPVFAWEPAAPGKGCVRIRVEAIDLDRTGGIG